MSHVVTVAVLALALAGCAEPTVRSAAPTPGVDLLAEGVVPAAAAPAAPPEPPAHLTLDPDEIGVPGPSEQPIGGIFDFVGVYHGGEAPAADGERWLGLYPGPTGWTLEAVTVRTQTAPDPIFWTSDGPEDPATGVEVVTDRTAHAPPAERRYDAGDYHDDGLYFLRTDALAPGPVVTAFSGGWALEPGADLSVGLPGAESVGLNVKYVRGRPRESVLTLDDVPVLHLRDRDAGHPTLFWAGDLDRDGEIDLVLDASPHYNATVLQLWLSSAADEGAPLGLVAEHGTTGC